MHLWNKKYVGKYVHEELSCQKGRLQCALDCCINRVDRHKQKTKTIAWFINEQVNNCLRTLIPILWSRQGFL